MFVIMIFLTALKGSIRVKMLIGNSATQIRGFYDVGGRLLTLFVIFHLSLHLFRLLHGGVAVSEGLWVMNAEERSQFLVDVAVSSSLMLATGSGSLTILAISAVKGTV